MERLPDPPAVSELRTKGPPTTGILVAGSLLWRIFPTGGRYPAAWNHFRSFGPTNSRFDHHPDDPPPRLHASHSILYAAGLPAAAFAEYFQKQRRIHRRLNRPWIVEFAVTQTLTYLDLTGGWIVKLKGGAAIASGSRKQARKWSRRFHEAFPYVDGICYRSSLNPEWLVFALYERASRAVPPEPLFRAPLTDSRVVPLIAHAVGETGYDLV